jgi:hypothetical protein
MMEFISSGSYLGLTLLLTLALAFHASEWGKYRVQGRALSHILLLAGWASIVARFWHGMGTDQTISYSGAIGLAMLASGVILRAMGR